MMDRRSFLIRSSRLAGSSLFSTMTASGVVHAAIPKHNNNDFIHHKIIRDFTQSDWATIATVQNHFLPSENDAPGAVEINALRYLYDFLNNPETDPIDIRFIHTGVRSLQAMINAEQANLSLMDQSIEQRETTLRKFEKQADGSRWLVNILNYVLEALLTDPVYGGNPNGIGWQWLEHRAGDPHPPMNKRYWLL